MVLATGMLLGGGVSASTLISLGALVPARVALEHEYWRLFTSMFLHANLFHIAFNMWALWVVGSFLERIMGSLRFVLLYLVVRPGRLGARARRRARRACRRSARPGPSSASSAPSSPGRS